MQTSELAELEAIGARVNELQERHWFAEKVGNREHAQRLARQLLGVQARRKQLVDRIIAREGDGR